MALPVGMYADFRTVEHLDAQDVEVFGRYLAPTISVR